MNFLSCLPIDKRETLVTFAMLQELCKRRIMSANMRIKKKQVEMCMHMRKQGEDRGRKGKGKDEGEERKR